MFFLPVFDNPLSQALPKTTSVKIIIKGHTCKIIILSHLPTGIKVVTSKGIGPIAFRMDMPTIAKIVKNTNLRFIFFIALAKEIKSENFLCIMYNHLMIMICLSVVLVKKFQSPSKVVLASTWDTWDNSIIQSCSRMRLSGFVDC